MLKNKKNIAIAPHYFSRLRFYGAFNSKERGDLIEGVAINALRELKCNFNRLSNEKIQYHLGDVIILSKEKSPILADIKASHTFNGLDKIALDYKHYKKGSEEPYIPSNSSNNSNEGYIYHLKANSLICINPHSFKLYIVNNFQTLRKNVLELIDDRGCTTSSLLEISVNRLDSDKDTKIINIAFQDMEKLGAEVFEYQLVKLEENDIIINENKKSTLCRQTESIS